MPWSIILLVTSVVSLLILIRVWKGSDLGFWAITLSFMVFGCSLIVLIGGWLYYSIIPYLN
jgi:hypothetical protein